MINKQDAEYIFESLVHGKTYDNLAQEFLVHKTTLCKWMKKYKEEFGMSSEEKYTAYTYLRYKHKQDIIDQYEQGMSTEAIAKYYGFSDDHMIAKLLTSFGVQVRPQGYSSKTNQGLFSNISNELQAYVLGLITADGSIDKHYSIHIHLTESDRALLDEINSRLYNNTGHILIEKKDNGKNVCRLTINGKKICDNLAQYGIIQNKSHTLTSLANLSSELLPHYIRGLYDGDGVCSKNGQYLRVGYCAYRKEFVEGFQNYLSLQLGVPKNQLFNTGNCWQCSWGSRQDLEKVYHFLYDNATIFLSRKQQKLASYLYGNTEVTNQITQGQLVP